MKEDNILVALANLYTALITHQKLTNTLLSHVYCLVPDNTILSSIFKHREINLATFA